MAIQSSLRGNFAARGANAATSALFGTTKLSAMSDFATRADHAPRWRMTLRILAIGAALVAWAPPALADTYVESTSCRGSWYYGDSNCRTTYTKIPAPVRNPEQERLDAIERQKEDAKWSAFCKPKFRTDEHGVRRAAYAVRGCEFGRSE